MPTILWIVLGFIGYLAIGWVFSFIGSKIASMSVKTEIEYLAEVDDETDEYLDQLLDKYKYQFDHYILLGILYMLLWPIMVPMYNIKICKVTRHLYKLASCRT